MVQQAVTSCRHCFFVSSSSIVFLVAPSGRHGGIIVGARQSVPGIVRFNQLTFNRCPNCGTCTMAIAANSVTPGLLIACLCLHLLSLQRHLFIHVCTGTACKQTCLGQQAVRAQLGVEPVARFQAMLLV